MRQENVVLKKLHFHEVLVCMLNSLIGRSIKNEMTLVSFPTSIGGYRLIHPILECKEPKFYQFGLYQNSEGKQAIAKQWSGTRKNLNYYWLLNEINAYRGVWYLYKKNPELQKHYPHIHIPKLLAVKQKSDRLIMLLEEVKGKSLETIKIPARIPIYEEVISFFRELGNHLDVSTSQMFRKRSAWTTGFLFIAYLGRAILKHPEQLPVLMKATFLFARRFPKLIQDKDISLVHRDLTPSNIFLQGKEIWIIDFQLLVITHRIFELAALNLKRWKDRHYWHLFQSTQTMKNMLNNPDSFAVYQALTIYLSVLNFVNTYQVSHEAVYDYLQYWLQQNRKLTSVTS